MIDKLASGLARAPKGQRNEEASARGTILALALILAAAAVGAFWLYQSTHRGPTPSGESTGTPPAALSEATLTALRNLDSAIEIHFYDVLDPATVPASVTAFAGRVDKLLSAYQQAAGGKVSLKRFDSRTALNRGVVQADGVQAFNRDKGEACYLGIALIYQGRRETLPYLSADWEQALEADLTRAIVRLEEAPRPATVGAAVPLEANTNAIREVKSMLPNLATVSVEEGTRTLREAALKEFTTAAKEFETQVKEAQQRLIQALNGGTDADQEAARKHLQQVQSEENEKLKEIAAKSKAQIDALQQLKAVPR